VLRVVLDTNIWISAVNFGGKPQEIIKLAVQKKIAIYSSQTLYAEFIGVSRKKFAYSEEKIKAVESLYKRLVKFREPKTTVNLISVNPPDNRVLECALEAKADFIISGDKKHLLSLKKFKNIPILPAAEFLKDFYQK